MNRIRRKLRSGKGASITFALLLFLVCAILSSVILVAGTAAAGRMSKMATTEQDYYSVTSTAKLIQEIMESGSSTMIRIKDDEGTEVYKPVDQDTGNQLTIIDNNTSLNLTDFVAYKICTNSKAEDMLVLSGRDATLTKVLAGMTIKEKNDTASDENNTVEFVISQEKYRVILEFSTHTDRSYIRIGDDDPSRNNEKVMYTWSLSNVKVY